MEAEIKDKIIQFLIEHSDDLHQIHPEDIAELVNTTDKMVRLFLKQLDAMGMLEYSELGCGYVQLFLTMNIYDFHEHGGFTVQDELLIKNIEKLYLEIEKLKPSFIGKTELLTNITAIGNNILSALGFFKS